MTIEEKILLDKILDSLDDLFDGEKKVIDLHKILLETEAKLSDTKKEINLSKYISELKCIINSKHTEDKQREIALDKTNSLRVLLAEIL